MTENATNTKFMVFLVVSQAIAIIMVALSIVWTTKTLKGFAWDGSAKEFNLHPLCMVCGFILLYGEAALAFRVFSTHEKSFVKVFHGLFHILAFVAAVVGLKAVFDFHNQNGIPNMYSLHSWCGLVTVLLFSLQYLFGFMSFFWPGAAISLRDMYMPIHKYFGLAILFLSAVSAISGINEKLFFVFKKAGDKYSEFPHGAVLGNCLGLSVLAYILVVGYIVYNPEWKRPESDETEPLTQFTRVSAYAETDED